MKTTFEKATEASRKGYIANPDSIDLIVDRLVSTPMLSFRCERTQFLIKMLSDFMNDSGMDSNRIYEVTFGEVLGMIELMFDYEAYLNDDVQLRAGLRLNLLAHVRNLLSEFYCQNNTIHLFMSITVSGYFRYLTLKGKVSGRKSYRKFRRSVQNNINFEIKDETTIKQFISEIASFQSTCWNIIVPIAKFENEMRSSYSDLYCFLITHFKQAFPDFFDLDKLKEKYKKEG